MSLEKIHSSAAAPGTPPSMLHYSSSLTSPFHLLCYLSSNTPSQVLTARTAAGPYSQAIRANGVLYVSGQIPADASGALIQDSITASTRQCCTNLKAILEEAGSSIEKVVRCGVYLTDMEVRLRRHERVELADHVTVLPGDERRVREVVQP